jgi:soluble lytic murein transglycosylase-like protein
MRLSRAIFAIAMIVFQATCTTDGGLQEVRVDEIVSAPAPPASTTPESRFRQAANESEAFRAATADLLLILDAKDAEAKRDSAAATNAWLSALKIAEGEFAKIAFEGWLRSYAKSLTSPPYEPAILAKLIQAELRDVQYLTTAKLTGETELAARVNSLIPGLVKLPAAEVGAPLPQGIPAGDPLLVKTSAAACAADSVQKPRYEAWSSTLPVAMQIYFQALVAECKGSSEALDLYVRAHQTLAANGLIYMAVEATSRLAALQRRSAKRQEASDTYLQLVKYWGMAKLDPAEFGMKKDELVLRRIDEHLWASRYRAQVADYENAKIYANRALTFVGDALSTMAADRKKLANFRAEAYHTLAFRISVEKKDMEAASSLTLLGLQNPDIDAEWVDRLNWYLGFYAYVSASSEAAIRHWQKVLTITKDESVKTATLFWLAKASMQVGREKSANEYLDELFGKYPLSFYSIVAAPLAGLSPPGRWREVFGDLSLLMGEFGDRVGEYDLDSLRRNGSVSRKLIRAELSIRAAMLEWGRITVAELNTAMRQSVPVRGNVSNYVYLSRLMFSAGSYLSAISLTSELSILDEKFWKEWPEQLLIYFPAPYLREFSGAALDHSLDPAVLLGIARQESGFSPSILSQAKAQGVMQLIAPTAERFRGGLEPQISISELLSIPGANITIGARYLKYLSTYYGGKLVPVIAAYNAGEYAVDTWLERRSQRDDLSFVELMPFGETKGYVRNVWRNSVVYSALQQRPQTEPRPIER